MEPKFKDSQDDDSGHTLLLNAPKVHHTGHFVSSYYCVTSIQLSLVGSVFSLRIVLSCSAAFYDPIAQEFNMYILYFFE